MTIKQISVTVGEITKGYINNEEQGVRGYDGLLDIRPPYQREFIYNEKEQQAVITTVLNGYPLNIMYWVKRSDDAECPYEVMDGQQRTLSLCEWQESLLMISRTSSISQPTFKSGFLITNSQCMCARERNRRNWSGSRPSTLPARL